MSKNQFLSTSELERHITGLYSKISAVATDDGVVCIPHYITFKVDYKDGTNCYSDDDGYHFTNFERGSLVKPEVVTDDLSEITYTALHSPVFYLARKYEVKHRIKNQDFRRLWFAKEMQYFAVIGEEYKKKVEAVINKVLEKVPYQDKSIGLTRQQLDAVAAAHEKAEAEADLRNASGKSASEHQVALARYEAAKEKFDRANEALKHS